MKTLEHSNALQYITTRHAKARAKLNVIVEIVRTAVEVKIEVMLTTDG